MPVLWKLQLRQKEKIVLTGLFALGFFVTVIQIARIFRVKNLKTVTDSEMLILWSIIEVSLGVRKILYHQSLSKLTLFTSPGRQSLPAFQLSVLFSRVLPRLSHLIATMHLDPLTPSTPSLKVEPKARLQTTTHRLYLDRIQRTLE